MLELVALALGVVVGYWLRDTRDLAKRALKQATVRPKSEDKDEEPGSMIIEPPTPEEQAKREFEARIKLLNARDKLR